MSSVDFNPAFLSKEALPPLPAPIATRGLIGWLRFNLFSSPLNSVMTLLALALIAVVVPPILNFAIFNAVWDGLGRDACLADKVGHPVGACWAFIRSRLPYFAYGQYPVDERWRVNVFFILEVIAFTWLLWPRIGAKVWGLAYLLIAFPILAYW